MTQRQVTHEHPLPTCLTGHAARHMHDARRASAGGGHFIECQCGSTCKHADFPAALRDWLRMQGHRGPYKKRQPAPAPAAEPATNANVVQLGLRLQGGARNG